MNGGLNYLDVVHGREYILGNPTDIDEVMIVRVTS
jgi:hypothetical protein